VKNGILASSAYAQPYNQGTNIQSVPPNTQIWFVLYAQVRQADGSAMRNIELDKKEGGIIGRRQAGELKKLTGFNLSHVENATSFVINRQATQNLQAPLQGHILWQQSEVMSLLQEMGLPEDTPLSILGLELLPETNGSFDDPLGGNLGQVRILRTSELYPVSNLCC